VTNRATTIIQSKMQVPAYSLACEQIIPLSGVLCPDTHEMKTFWIQVSITTWASEVHSCVIYKETIRDNLTHELCVSGSNTVTGKVQGSNYKFKVNAPEVLLLGFANFLIFRGGSSISW